MDLDQTYCSVPFGAEKNSSATDKNNSGQEMTWFYWFASDLLSLGSHVPGRFDFVVKVCVDDKVSSFCSIDIVGLHHMVRR